MKIKFPGCLLLLFVLALVLCGCQDGGEGPVQASLGEPFTLGLGESATIHERGLNLTFAEVIRDMRCPTRVLCEVDGPVEILVILQIQGSEATRYEMNPEQVLVPLGWAPHEVRFLEYVVRLVSVNPFPETLKDKESYEDYQATFVITEGE
ncbi:hypothetical protein ACFLUA_01020 [Chloroflexota bacterium]